MTASRAAADALTWSLARRCRPGDVLVVGVATPLAAAAGLLARELLVPDLTLIVAASVNPATHDVAEGVLDPAAVARRSAGTLPQGEILDMIGRGKVTLQFVSPAEVDATGAINTNRIAGRDGTPRRLPGALALPDTSVLIGRLVAYRAGHSPRFLVPQVRFVTGIGSGPGRERVPGAGVTAIVTDRAEIDLPAGGEPTLTALQPGAELDATLSGCGFPLAHTDPPPVAEPLPPEARRLLDEVIDPHRVRELETRDGRAAAQARLQALSA